MSMKRAGREAIGVLMVAPVGVGEWCESGPAAPDRRTDSVAPLGGVSTRHRLPVVLVQERWEAGRLRALPGRAGGGVGEDDG
jgi:hypothetical protein